MAYIYRSSYTSTSITLRVDGLSADGNLKEFWWTCSNGDSGWGVDASGSATSGGSITFSGLNPNTSYGFRVTVYVNNVAQLYIPGVSSYTYYSTDSIIPDGYITASFTAVDNCAIYAQWSDQQDGITSRWVYVFARNPSSGDYTCLKVVKASSGRFPSSGSTYSFYVNPYYSGEGCGVILSYSSGSSTAKATEGRSYSYSGITSNTTIIDTDSSYWSYSFTVMFDRNTLAANMIQDPPATISYGPSDHIRTTTKTITIPRSPVPSRMSDSGYNYNFLGYSTNQYASSATYSPGDQFTAHFTDTGNGADVLYCVWEAVPRVTYYYTVYFQENISGVDTGSMPTSPVVLSYPYDTMPWNIPSDSPTRSGATFRGWAEDDTSHIADYFPDSSLILSKGHSNGMYIFYAIWRWNTKAWLEYKDNAGTDTVTNKPNDSSHYVWNNEVGADVTIPSNTPVRTGYTFIGYNSQADGSGTWYYKDRTYTFPMGTNNLYCMWQPNWIDIDDFEWTVSDGTYIAQGQPVSNITAARWNGIFDFISDARYADGSSRPPSSAFDTSRVDAGDVMTAYTFNELLEFLDDYIYSQVSRTNRPGDVSSGEMIDHILFAGVNVQSIKQYINDFVKYINDRH